MALQSDRTKSDALHNITNFGNPLLQDKNLAGKDLSPDPPKLVTTKGGTPKIYHGPLESDRQI